jgi:hypothetical protein
MKKPFVEWIDPELKVEVMEDGLTVCLTEPLCVKLTWSGTILYDIIRVEVPAGFQTDFASIPRFFWRILPPWGKYSKAAVVHDYIYATQGRYNRQTADTVFNELMRDLKVVSWRRAIIYYAVRLFGWLAWMNKEAYWRNQDEKRNQECWNSTRRTREEIKQQRENPPVVAWRKDNSIF